MVLFLNSLTDCCHGRHAYDSGLKYRMKKWEVHVVIVHLREDTTSDDEYCLWKREMTSSFSWNFLSEVKKTR
jgi:hypothetical protein